MRFTLFGVGEGVLTASAESLWVCTRENIVTDASLSARELGVRVGWPVKSARAVAPQLVVYEEPDQVSSIMETVWQVLWTYAPWLKTVDKNAFYLQIPGRYPPIREVRDLLLNLDERLSVQQRFRIGLAESPDLARGLVEWSRLERIAGARYYKVGRQQWLLSPSLVSATSGKTQNSSANWIRLMPIQSHWKLSEKSRTQLRELGISRLEELTAIPPAYLQRHFGKAAILWPELLIVRPGCEIQCNYPPQESRQSWQADIGEMVDIERRHEILRSLLVPLVAVLMRFHMGAHKVGIMWTTDVEEKEFERVPKRPIHDTEALYAAIEPGLEQCRGRRIERLVIYAQDLRPVGSVQMTLTLHETLRTLQAEKSRHTIPQVIHQVNQKFPRGLRRGLRPGFRELRLQAIVDGK